MEEGIASQVLEGLSAGRVRVVFAGDPIAARHAVVAEAERTDEPPTVVTLHWREAPRLDEELERALLAVAEAALSLWPRWYARLQDRLASDRWQQDELAPTLEMARLAGAKLSSAWLHAVWQKCQARRLPIVDGMVAATQLEQLSLALDPRGPLLLLSVSSSEAPPTRIHALARVVEWLSQEMHTAAVLVVPEAWRALSELDCVSYGALHWRESLPVSAVASVNAAAAEPQVVVEPVVGVPHPLSVVEGCLHEHLTSDAELGPLFCYNARIQGFGGRYYRVDLLWPEGRLVIEVDGPDHGQLTKYQSDRDRDYRLLMADYAVLRVTNAEVVLGVGQVIEKIRSVVRRRAPSRRSAS